MGKIWKVSLKKKVINIFIRYGVKENLEILKNPQGKILNTCEDTSGLPLYNIPNELMSGGETEDVGGQLGGVTEPEGRDRHRGH